MGSENTKQVTSRGVLTSRGARAEFDARGAYSLLMLRVLQRGARVPRDYVKEGVDTALLSLTKREQQVMRGRSGMGHERPLTLAEIGIVYGCTREAVRRVEVRALAKLRRPAAANVLRSRTAVSGEDLI